MTPEEANKILNEEKKSRVENCGEEISKVLEKFKCQLDIVTIIKNDETPKTMINIKVMD